MRYDEVLENRNGLLCMFEVMGAEGEWWLIPQAFCRFYSGF